MFTNLPLVLFYAYILQVESQIYYITPDSNYTCYVNGSSRLPCLKLGQMNKTLLSDKDSVTLHLLPGRHVIQKLSAFNVTELAILPWKEMQEVEIECQSQSLIYFQDIGEVRISWVKFVFCSLECVQTGSGLTNYSVHVIDCILTYSEHNYAITTRGIDNVTITGSTFCSNFGGIFSTNNNRYSSVNGHRMQLHVFDTYFCNNNNSRREYSNGAAVCIDGVNLRLNGCEFVNNTATSGGAIYSVNSKVLINDSVLGSNDASILGGAICCFISGSIEIYNALFVNNSANGMGGAIYIKYPEIGISMVENVSFCGNHAGKSGGAIYFNRSTNVRISSCSFLKNSAEVFGGALYFYINYGYEASPHYIIKSNFTFNQAKASGGAMYCYGLAYGLSVVVSSGNSNFNSARKGGFAYQFRCKLYIIDETDIVNSSASISGGAVYAQESIVSFSGTCNIAHNTARDSGGALYLANSRLSIGYGTVISFYYNTVTSAAGKGGAVFVLDKSCEVNYQCFIYGEFLAFPRSKYLNFSNNEASKGSVLYGGSLNSCIVTLNTRNRQSFGGIEFFKQISNYQNTPLAISSIPIKVCFCVSNNECKPDCNSRELNSTKMRGQAFNITLATVDQDENPVPSIVRASYNELSAQLDKGEEKRETLGKYLQLNYHIFTAGSKATLILETEGLCRHSEQSIATLHIGTTPCAGGFEQGKDRCICDRRLVQRLSVTVCNIESQSIRRVGSIWLKYDEQHLKIHTSCPLDYCQVRSNTISLLSPDDQCANNRSGVICGACKDKHSIVLGTSRCLRCTSRYTFIWLTLVFAVAGVALVALLLVCNMTISTGTLNGLIFYANVVSISGLTNLQDCSIHPILSVFIAWVNLDFGVETCFYLGMDTYQKTWLQFAFPLYIWLLVVAIIVASYYSSTAMKVFGRNNIAILATLFLLSYTKILKTITTALTFTQVLVSKADNVSDQFVPNEVWTYDGNIEYLKGKHVVLFVVALLLLLLLFLPYTLLLIFGQCVRSLSVRRRWGLQFLHGTAFISIMDAYHAPYNKRHRYWTGLMLLTRCFLFLVFATNNTEDMTLTNMYAVTVIITGILIGKTFTTSTYKRFSISTLELCFLLNLELLSSTINYLKGKVGSSDSICKTVTSSICISLVIFVFILGYHIHLKLKNRSCYISIRRKIFSIWHTRENHATVNDDDASFIGLDNKMAPTTTSVQLREPLLDNEKTVTNPHAL